MTDKTPEWDGTPVVQTASGTVWLRQPDGRYHLPAVINSARTPEELVDLDPRPVELHPATTPEPRTVTWRKGEDETAIREAWKPGRRAQVVTEGRTYTVTRDGEISSHGYLGGNTLGGWLERVAFDVVSITVWLPETPEVPEWAQDYDIPGDARMVITDDKRVWRPAVANAAHIETWRWKGNRETEAATTEELVAMGGRLLIDRDGKAVL